MRPQRIVRIASMSNALRKEVLSEDYTLTVTAVRSMDGILKHWQSVISGRKRRNDEMGKAAHVGVGRLFSVGGVQGRGCMNNARG